MNKKTIIGIIVLILIGVGGWYLLSKNSISQIAGEPVKIGVILPLTGDVSGIGTGQRAAIEIAIDEINAAGGLNGAPVSAVYEDSQCNPTSGVSAAQKLINVDHVMAIIGDTCSSPTTAFGPLAMENKIIVLSPSASAENLNTIGKYFFRAYPSDAYQGKFAAEYAYNTLGARKVAVLYHVSNYGTGIKNIFGQRFQELGGIIVLEEGAPQEAKDYRTELTKIKDSNHDLIFAPTYTDGAKVLLAQGAILGIKTTFLGADAWDDPSLFPVVSGKGTFFYSLPKSDIPDSFKLKIQAKTGNDTIPVGTTSAYDEVKILAAAIAKVGTDPDKLADAIRATKYDGVSGHIEFDQNGDLKAAAYVVKKIENGTATEVK